ncbi:hypothetical protein KIH39_25550 [Telmatocola sphagniphila]|uniref:Tetratricopeptide repeat protein n=1 Tax=Telmatocola sphagniphila TaxID=1123043 RepID=A0A8E6B694_9BACT|nr:hypothetical protein [Telmatocola sphagniphila]QVL32162.1 hypothetical protein KIH39_25550 [Telmatocola sphagniphila]
MRSFILSRVGVALLGTITLAGFATPNQQLYAQGDTKTAEKKNEDVDKAEKAFNKGQFDECLKFLQDAEKKDPKIAPARLNLARFFLTVLRSNQIDQNARLQVFQMARTNLERAVIENPNHPECYLEIASIALSEFRFTETILACQTALTLAKSDKWSSDQKKIFEKEANAGLATAFDDRGDWESAKTHYLAWKILDPKSAPLMQRLAKVYFNLNKADEAFVELTQAKAEDPTLDPPEVAMGLLWANKPNKAKAEEWFQKAITKNPKLARVHQAYGGWLLDTGNLAAAKISINQAKTLDPMAPETQSLLGLLARYENRLDEAEKIFEDLMRSQPANFFASNQLAQVLAEQTSSPSQQQRALQIAGVNKDRLSRNPEAWSTLGWVLLKVGKESDAEQALNTSITLSNKQVAPDTAYFIASVLKKKDEKKFSDEIRKYLEGAIAAESAFIHRADAVRMLTDLNSRYPKKEEPKDSKKEPEGEKKK